MIDDADYARIAQWAAGDLSAADADATYLWIQEVPERARLADSLARIMDASVAWDTRRALDDLRARPTAGSQVARAASKPFRVSRARKMRSAFQPSSSWMRWPLQAAVLLAIAVAASPLFQTTREQQHVVPAPTTTSPPPSTTHVTRQGERLNVTLSDGSQVMLAPESRLRVPGDFRAKRRDLWLDGEAFFQVAHDESRPFTVFTNDAVTRDLGTAFGIRAYGAEPVRVAVREGAVILSGAGRLNAGDVGELAPNGHVQVRRNADVDRILGWMRGEFSYEGTALRIVLADLERWRGLHVTLADTTLGKMRFTGILAGISNSLVVPYVAATAGLEVVQQGETFILRKRAPSLPGVE